jgi:arylsulfatase A-like enzyme
MAATVDQLNEAAAGSPLPREESGRGVARTLARAALVGLVTALLVATWDVVSAWGGDITGSRAHFVLSAASQLILLCVPLSALLGLWWLLAWRLAARAGAPVASWRKWVFSAAAGLPLLAGVWWVPYSWVDESLPTLSEKEKWLVGGVYVGLLLVVVGLSRAMWWLHEHYRRDTTRLPRVHWLLLAAALATSVVCYWADATLMVDLYEDFHYGLSGAFVLGIAACALAAHTALQRLRPRLLERLTAPRPWLLVAWCGLLLACFLIQLSRLSASRAPGALVLSKLTLAVLRHSDFDDDGYSAFFGGLDCAPFDQFRGPAQVDLPNNGSDEDCTGSDAQWPKPQPVKSYPIPDARGYNVLLITVDALRADHTSVFGYSRKTTPHLERLAQRGLAFSRAYAQGTKTFESLPSLLTGLYLANVPRDYKHRKVKGRRAYMYRMTDEAGTFTQLFDEQGYVTRGIVALDWLDLLGLERGFDKFVSSHRDTDTNKLAKKFLRNVSQPFFMWLHYFNPHDPYNKHPEHDFGSGELDRYDSEIASVDASIGMLMGELESAGVADKTIIIVTADHGEEFREHGGQFHTNKLYQELLHVPLIISNVPGVAPARVDEVVELVDVAPTLCEAFALRPSCKEFDGQSLWAARAGQRDQSPGFRGAYAESLMREGTLRRRSLLSQGYRLTVNLDLETLELFDVKRDPREAHNIAHQFPERVKQLREEMALRPYRRLAAPFEAAQKSDSAALQAALPLVRSEPLLRQAVELIARHPSRGARQALENLKSRPGLGPSVHPKLDEALSQVGK